MQQVQEQNSDVSQGQYVAVGSAEYSAILTFLYEEAALLDQLRLNEWGARLATDLVYTAPLRHTRLGVDHAKSFVRSVMHFHDDYLVVNENYETNIPGVYATGDVIQKEIYQIINAASEGAIAGINLSHNKS